MVPRILIIDDVQFMRKLIRDILINNGFGLITEAADAAEGFEVYRAERPDIVILDVMMNKDCPTCKLVVKVQT